MSIFGLPNLVDYFRGMTSPHDMRPEDREIRALERHGEAKLIDVYQAGAESRDPLDLQATVLPSSTARAQKAGGFGDFKRRFEHFTGSISDILRDIQGPVFAGGA